jgi:hypothetical protein
LVYIWGISSYRLNDEVFDTKAAVEAAKNELGYYKKLTWQQRMLVANYLNSIAYGYPENDPPRMDKTVFWCGTNEENDKRLGHI